MSDEKSALPVHPGLLDGRERDLLAVLARVDGEAVTVRQATDALADYHDDTRRSHVLGHLDDLERGDLVEEGAEGWRLTMEGQNVLRHHVGWLANALGLSTVDADHRLADAEPATQGGGD